MLVVIPELEKKCKELNCKEGAFNINRDGILLATGKDKNDFSNKELYDHVMKILNMIYESPTDIKEDTNN